RRSKAGRGRCRERRRQPSCTRSYGGRRISCAGRWTRRSTRDFVLGLVFLKYASDSFGERRAQIRAELAADNVPEARFDQFLDDIDEYTREGVFWVPEGARWDALAQQAKSAGIGELIDNAMDSIMKTNQSLTGVLPKIFNRDNVDQNRLGQLVDLMSDARFTGHDGKKDRSAISSWMSARVTPGHCASWPST